MMAQLAWARRRGGGQGEGKVMAHNFERSVKEICIKTSAVEEMSPYKCKTANKMHEGTAVTKYK